MHGWPAWNKGKQHQNGLKIALWQMAHWTSYGSLGLPRHSLLDLLANSVSSMTIQLLIFGVISAVAPHSFPPCTTSPVNAGWNLDNDEINVQVAIIFRQWDDTFSPSSLIPTPYTVIVSRALSVNKICILFWRIIINLKLTHNEIISPYQTDQKSCTLPNWLVVFSGQLTEDAILGRGFAMSQYA